MLPNFSNNDSELSGAHKSTELLKSIAGTELWNQKVNEETWQKCRIYNDNFGSQETDGVKMLKDGIKPFSDGSK